MFLHGSFSHFNRDPPVMASVFTIENKGCRAFGCCRRYSAGGKGSGIMPTRLDRQRGFSTRFFQLPIGQLEHTHFWCAKPSGRWVRPKDVLLVLAHVPASIVVVMDDNEELAMAQFLEAVPYKSTYNRSGVRVAISRTPCIIWHVLPVLSRNVGPGAPYKVLTIAANSAFDFSPELHPLHAL